MHSPLPPKLNLDRRRWLNTGLASAVALSQAFNVGCSSEVERTFEYLQDVKLNDGKIVTLRFKDVILATSKVTDNYKRLLKQEMWYEPLGVYYLDEPWDVTGAHRLMSFDIVNGVPMLVQSAHHKDVVSRPSNNCSFNYFKWVMNNWIEVPETEFPLHIVGYNLHRTTYNRGDSKLLQKRGISNPLAMGDTPLTMLAYAKGVGACLGKLRPNEIQNKEVTK